MSTTSNTEGSIYLIQPAELVGTAHYKIGCSKKNDLQRVRNGYRKGKRYILILKCEDPFIVEARIKGIFNSKFILIAGTEYYKGEETAMIEEFLGIYLQISEETKQQHLLDKGRGTGGDKQVDKMSALRARMEAKKAKKANAKEEEEEEKEEEEKDLKMYKGCKDYVEESEKGIFKGEKYKSSHEMTQYWSMDMIRKYNKIRDEHKAEMEIKYKFVFDAAKEHWIATHDDGKRNYRDYLGTARREWTQEVISGFESEMTKEDWRITYPYSPRTKMEYYAMGELMGEYEKESLLTKRMLYKENNKTNPIWHKYNILVEAAKENHNIKLQDSSEPNGWNYRGLCEGEIYDLQKKIDDFIGDLNGRCYWRNYNGERE